MAAHHASIPGIRAWKGVQDFGLRLVFVLLATWPFILAFFLLREAMHVLF